MHKTASICQTSVRQVRQLKSIQGIRERKRKQVPGSAALRRLAPTNLLNSTLPATSRELPNARQDRPDQVAFVALDKLAVLAEVLIMLAWPSADRLSLRLKGERRKIRQDDAKRRIKSICGSFNLDLVVIPGAMVRSR